MNQLGMLVDVSHAHPVAVDQILSISTYPVIASHSCAAAICPVTRNLTDSQIESIAERGGMIGVNFFPGFLDHQYYKQLTERCGNLLDQSWLTESLRPRRLKKFAIKIS